jgi:hypothetical protein
MIAGKSQKKHLLKKIILFRSTCNIKLKINYLSSREWSSLPNHSYFIFCSAFKVKVLEHKINSALKTNQAMKKSILVFMLYKKALSFNLITIEFSKFFD